MKGKKKWYEGESPKNISESDIAQGTEIAVLALFEIANDSGWSVKNIKIAKGPINVKISNKNG